jgi:hypothetical protein
MVLKTNNPYYLMQILQLCNNLTVLEVKLRLLAPYPDKPDSPRQCHETKVPEFRLQGG